MPILCFQKPKRNLVCFSSLVGDGIVAGIEGENVKNIRAFELAVVIVCVPELKG